MLINGMDFSEELTNAIREDKLVVFVGAGVSVNEPTCLPNFTELVHRIADGTASVFNEEKSKHDTFLGELEHKGIDVKRKTADLLINENAKPNVLHKSIINLFGTKYIIRIVTTNYDHMLEKVLKKKSILIHNTPALPLGNDFEGIVHIHGNQNDPKRMILTDSDFGNAYLLEGYATRFLSKLFSEFTVLFIGYSYGDTVMTYLSRALPDKQSKKRFILTHDNEKAWDMLGIIPITFPKGNFNILKKSLKEYGFRVNRNMVGWRNKCIELSMNLPLNDAEGIDELKELFSMPEVLSLFLENLGDKNYNEWIEWFKKNGYLEFVTEDRIFSELDSLMSNWLIKTDIQESNLKNITLLILDRNNRINKKFALRLLETLCKENDNISNEVYTKSIILFGNMLKEMQKFQLFNLLECCLKRNLKHLALSILKIVFEPDFVLKKVFRFADEKVVYEGRYDNQNDSYFLKEIWETYIKNDIDYYTNSIISILVDVMEKRQIEFELFNDVRNPYDVDTFFKDIETEIDEEENVEELIFICKMILDVLTHIGISNDLIYRSTINRLINSPSYTLKSIALISLRKSENFTATEKTKIILNNYDLYQLSTKTSVFRIVADIFNQIEFKLQNEILLNISKKIDMTSSEEANSKNYEVFNWLIHLMNKCPENELLKGTFDKHYKLFVNFEPREHPELSFSFSEATWQGNNSPLAIKELEAMSVNEIYAFIEGYHDERDKFESNVSKEGLLNMVFELTDKNFKKNRALMEEYINNENYSSEVWEYLLKDLGKKDLNKKDIKFVLNLMITKKMVLNHDIIISNLLKELIDNNSFFDNYFVEFEKQILQIIDLLFNFTTYRIPDHESFVMVALNSSIYNTIGALLAIINKGKIEEGVSFEYKKIINDFLSKSEDRKLFCGVTMLLGYYRILYVRDKLWVKSDIFHFLRDDDTNLFRSAWEGILTFSPSIYADVAEDLHEYYHAAIGRIDEFSGEVQKKFVSSLAILLMYSVKNPNKNYIPELFTKADSELKCVLIRKIRLILKNMSIEERNNVWAVWLNKFISNIKLNIPVTLENNELKGIFEWLPYTGIYFSEIVDLVSEFKPIRFDDFYTIKRALELIRNDQQYHEMNNSKIHLLSYILKCSFDNSYCDNEIKELYDTLIFKKTKDQEEVISLALRKHIDLYTKSE